MIDNFLKNLSLDMANIQQFAMRALQRIGSFVLNIPSTLIFIFFTILSTFFLTVDRELVTKTIRKFIPKRTYDGVIQAKQSFSVAAWGFVRAQMILFLIVTLELVVGFSLLRMDYVVALALSVAIVDALPVFGVGTVLVPWGLISILLKDYRIGVSLLALYAVMFTVRQIIEPKIVSVQIGMHPLLTLLSMYAGLKTFGLIGMMLFPIVLIIIINLYKAGTFSEMKNNLFPERNKSQ